VFVVVVNAQPRHKDRIGRPVFRQRIERRSGLNSHVLSTAPSRPTVTSRAGSSPGHDFTLALATVAADAAGPFVFCYLSGAGADPGETSTFPWERLTRHLKGRTEQDLRAPADAHPRFTV
jgi:hypothetical protein